MTQYIDTVDHPTLPADVAVEVYRSLEQSKNKKVFAGTDYAWMDPTPALEHWLNTNISDKLTWGVQYLANKIDAHVDEYVPGGVKLYYLVDVGSNNVHTHWHDAEGNSIYRHCLQAHKWYRMRVDVMHSVDNITNGQARVGIGGFFKI